MTNPRPDDVATTGRALFQGLYVDSPADRFVEAMEDAEGGDRVILATRAVRHDPGCIEARLVLAEHARDEHALFRHLEKAVESGELMWAPVAEAMGADLAWWGDAGTRPYMRAIAALGQAHLRTGDDASARACFDRLLAMNPRDNQGIRYLVEKMDDVAEGPAFR